MHLWLFRTLDLPESKIIGRHANDLSKTTESNRPVESPWAFALTTDEKQVNCRITLKVNDKKELIFRVTAIPIKDGKGQGIIASFNNNTELESKNGILKKMVKNLVNRPSMLQRRGMYVLIKLRHR